MRHKGTTTIHTQRLVLRRFTIDDAQRVFENWTSDQEVTKYARQQVHVSVDDTKLYLSDLMNAYANTDTYYWAITLKSDNIPIGRINITGINEPIESVCVSFMIGREWWNKGYITEALYAVVQFFLRKWAQIE